jgi:hypothetical protein
MTYGQVGSVCPQCGSAAAGGSRVLPMSSVTRGITLEQADALVAQLRAG